MKHSVYQVFTLILLLSALCRTSAFVTLNDRINRITLNSNVDGKAELDNTDFGDVGFVLLAGGTGSRMKASMRKLLSL